MWFNADPIEEQEKKLTLETGPQRIFEKLVRPIVTLDIETTGLKPRVDRIVSLAAIKHEIDGSTIEKLIRINPEMTIPQSAIDIHGISNDDVKDCPPFRRYAKSLLAFLDGCDLSGFNFEYFDLPFLIEEFRRADIVFDVAPFKVVDTCALFRRMEPRTLEAAHIKYLGEPVVGAHDPLNDCKASDNVLLAMLDAYPDVGETVEEVHELIHPRPEGALDITGKFIETPDGIVFGFGKHEGERIDLNPDYLRWMLDNGTFDGEVREICENTLSSL